MYLLLLGDLTIVFFFYCTFYLGKLDYLSLNKKMILNLEKEIKINSYGRLLCSLDAISLAEATITFLKCKKMR